MLAVPQLYTNIEQLPEDMQIAVSNYVSFLLEKVKKNEQENRQELAKIMHEIAEQGGTVFDRENIDGMAWQKEVRQDKVLVGREDE